MNERDTTPDKLLALKESLLTAFQALPPEHQATISLVILGRVMEGEWGDWTQDAINRLYPSQPEITSSTMQFPAVTREQLQQAGFSPVDIHELTEDDMRNIADAMRNHYVNDFYWDELHFHTANLLDEKYGPAHSAGDHQGRTDDTTG